MEELALLGGEPLLKENQFSKEYFKWPILTKEDEDAALEVIRAGKFSETDITMKFEEEFAEWIGANHALTYCNGTQALAAAMFAIGLGAGDEIICTTKTYWASITPALIFGATPVFCNMDENLSMDVDDIERCITPKTKAIMVVHYCAYPCNMDRIMEIADKHNLMVIEDVSHAQGGKYKGRRLGTIGHIGAMSMMSEKSFAIGEGGMLITDDQKLYERAMAYGHYERNNEKYITDNKELEPFFGVPLGGVKARLNQVSSAIGRVQLKYYDERCAEISMAMHYFWDLIEEIPGLRGIRTPKDSDSTMAGWYACKGMYDPREFHGLSVRKFCEAVRAEMNDNGFTFAGANFCLHSHNLFKKFDFRNAGKASTVEYMEAAEYYGGEACDRSMEDNCFAAPAFRRYNKELIEAMAACFKKVAKNHMQLVEVFKDDETVVNGRWFGTAD